MSERPLRILIADDDDGAIDVLTRMIRRLRPDALITATRRGTEALLLGLSMRPDLAILDHRMPGMLGDQVAEVLRSVGVDCHVVTSSHLWPALQPAVALKDELRSLVPHWLGVTAPA